MINWNNDKATIETMSAIAKRGVELARSINVQYDQMTAIMDIDACHSNGNPLKLQELLEADNFNFRHDIMGIRAHIDRNTGELQDCFVPRYSL